MRHFHRHHRAQALRRSAAGLGGELSGDFRRRRGFDFRPRHRHRRDRRRQSQGLRHVRLYPRGVPSGERRHARHRRAPVHAGGRSCPDRARRGGRASERRMARQEQGRHAALARGVRQARHHRRRQDRILALARDITDRKTAEAALRASEEQYRSMFNASIDGLALWNAAGEIVDTNPALWRMYGYSDSEFSTLPPGSLGGPVLSPRFSARGRRRRIAAFGGHRSRARTAPRSSSRSTESRCSTRASRTC